MRDEALQTTLSTALESKQFSGAAGREEEIGRWGEPVSKETKMAKKHLVTKLIGTDNHYTYFNIDLYSVL
ncbi:MAG: hypothetical protein QXQ93_01660 [Ignisphaera sp.]